VLAPNYRLLILIRISVIRGVTKGTRGGGGRKGGGSGPEGARPQRQRAVACTHAAGAEQGGWGWLLGGPRHSAGQRDRGGRPLIGGPQPK
jgi:hypothetical protein